MDTLITPKPAWNFLFLYQILKFLPGPLEPLGTAGAPLVIVLLFASLPFVDSSPEKNPFKRGFVISCGLAFVGVILYLTYLGFIYRSPAEVSQMDHPNQMVVLTNKKLPDMDLEKAMLAANVKRKVTGKELFKTLGCTECHTITGLASNKQGPDLVMAKGNNRSHQWLHDQIVDPQSHNPRTIMPPFSHLSQEKVELLVNFIESLKPATPVVLVAPPVVAQGSNDNGAAMIKYGEQLFNAKGCVQCHTVQGYPSNKPGPDLILAIKKDMPNTDWLKTQLMTPQAHNPLSIMPSFANRLNDSELNAVIVFLKSLSTRKATPMPAGMSASTEAQASSGVPTNSSAVSSVGIIGDKEHGAILFHQSCIMCHGPHGNPLTPGFNHPKGVPSLNPIDRNVFNADPQTFVLHIDQFIQHGIPNTEGGPNMPNFGDSHALTQAQIADLEAYVLSLNGVDRTQIMNPGIEPKEFFYMIVTIFSAVLLIAGMFWFLMKLLKI